MDRNQWHIRIMWIDLAEWDIWREWTAHWLISVQVFMYISLLWRSLRGARCLLLDAVPWHWLRLCQRTAGVVPLSLCPGLVRPAVRERRSVRGPTLSSRRNVRHSRPSCSVVTRSTTSQSRCQVRFTSPYSLYVHAMSPSYSWVETPSLSPPQQVAGPDTLW